MSASPYSPRRAQSQKGIVSYALTCLVVMGTAAILLIGAMISKEAEARPSVITTDYNNGSLRELIQVYKQAYSEAGFKFREQTIELENAPGGRNFTRLTFDFPVPGYPNRKNGIISFVIYSQGPIDRACAPCSLHIELYGLDYAEFKSAERVIVQHKMDSAAQKADAQIEKKLGKSIRSTPPLPQEPSRRRAQ